MKKKILFSSLSILLLSSLSLIAQNWTVGGNLLAAGGGELGSNNNQHVFFETNGSRRGIISNSGRWGFGITNAGGLDARVHINSGVGLNPLQVDVAGTAALVVTGANSRVGIGTTAPSVRLHVVGGSDAEPGNSGGFIVAGNINDLNVAIDNNEIMARDNGVATTLFLNNDGGDLDVSQGALLVSGATNNVSIGGTLDVAGAQIGFGSVETLSDAGNNTIGANSDFIPTSDGIRSLGISANRWENVWAVDGTINTSDLRDKSNIRDLNYGLREILQLRSIRYNWKTSPASGEKLGLVAQELQKVLPEVVRDWEYKVNEQTGQREKVASARIGVMYSDIIPVLIRGMQEQQQIIQNQRKEINDFRDRLAKLEAAVNAISGNNTNSKAISASLQQNQPNPFNQITTIRYTIPQGVNAQIMVYDATGKLVKTLQATKSGQSQINAGELSPGTYQYALMANGTVLAAKKMVLLK